MFVRRRIAGIPAFACLLLLACSTPEERFAEHVERAEGYIAENRVDDALIELQSALKIDPDDPDVNYEMAHLLKARGSIQAAAFHFGETHRLDPTRVEAAVEQATLLSQSAPRRARQILRQARRQAPDDAHVHRGIATLAASQGRSDVAIAAALRAVELAPEDPDTFATAGAVYLQRTREMRGRGETPPDDDYMAGIAAFEKLDELTGGHVGARVEKARMLIHMGRDEAGIGAFQSAIGLARSRDDADALVYAARRLAGFARRSGRFPLRVDALRAIVEADPARVRDWEELALVTQGMEGIEAAEAVYREMLQSQPDLPEAHVAWSRFLLRARREADAIAHLDQAISEGHEAPEIWDQLVRIELSEGRVADARATIEDMRSRLGDHDVTRLSEVRLALRERRADAALEILKDFAGSRETADTELLRARAEMQRGDLGAAASAAERAVTLSRGRDPIALRLKAQIHDEAGEWQAVLATLGRLEARQGSLHASDRVIRARAHYELGDDAKGLATLESVLGERRPPPTAAVEFARREGSGKRAEARRHLEQALALVPSYHPALEAVTRMELADGRPAEALARLDQLVERRLAGPRVLLLRSQILAHMGQLDRAEADALRAFEAMPEMTDAVDMLFVIYQGQDKLEEARRSFEEAESIGVLHKGARVLLGRLYVSEGETEKARAMYEKVLDEDPEMVSAKLDLARLLAEDDDEVDRALELAEQAQRALPDDPAIADTVGYLYQRKGRHEVALQQFRYALDLARSQDLAPPVVHYHLGVSLTELGRHPEAAAAFDRALEIDPQFEKAREARTRLDTGTSAKSSS